MPDHAPAGRQIPEGGYEVIGSQMYLSRAGPLEPETEARIIAAVHAMLAG